MYPCYDNCLIFDECFSEYAKEAFLTNTKFIHLSEIRVIVQNGQAIALGQAAKEKQCFNGLFVIPQIFIEMPLQLLDVQYE